MHNIFQAMNTCREEINIGIGMLLDEKVACDMDKFLLFKKSDGERALSLQNLRAYNLFILNNTSSDLWARG